MLEGVDYSFARPDPKCLHTAGKFFACRYLSYNTSGKNLTKAEADQLTAAGIAIVSNWENVVGDAKNGYDAGARYAREADRQAAACGAPSTRPIYFSVDFDTRGASDKTIEAIRQYFAGVHSVIGKPRTGIYGGYHTIDLAAHGRWATWFWQTYAWSSDRWHTVAHLRQYRNGVQVCGGDCDLDRAMIADFGQWGVSMTTPAELWGYGLRNDKTGTVQDADDRLIDTQTKATTAATEANAAKLSAEGGLAAAERAGIAAEAAQVSATAAEVASHAAQTAAEAVLARLDAAPPVAGEVTLSAASLEQIRAIVNEQLDQLTLVVSDPN